MIAQKPEKSIDSNRELDYNISMVDIIRYSEIELEEIYNEDVLEMEDQDLKELE